MKRNYLLPLIAMLLMFCQKGSAQQLWGNLKPGTHAVGFKTTKQRDLLRNNRPMIICTWYPAKKAGQPLTFKDYLFSGIINESFSDPTEEEKTKFAKEFKEYFSLPHFFGLPEDSLKKFGAVLNMPVLATKNAQEKDGRFPTVIMSSEPESLCVTAEYLASQGFVVMAIQAPGNMEMPPESLIWDAVTKDMMWLAEYTKKMNIVDQNKIAAMGFGGGIISPFYLTMKTDHVKALVNLEGAVFQPFSLITKSADYHPEKMKTPMLHIVTAGTRKNESEEEIKAIHTTLYRLLVANQDITHHDFSIFGRVMNHGLGLYNKNASETEEAYVAAHQVILDFLNSYLGNDKGLFDIRNINGVFRIEQ